MNEKKIMRIIVMFDLPTLTPGQRRTYRIFRKWLIKEGFIMMQESIYSKLVLNGSSVKLVIEKIRKQKLNEGIVQVLTLSEKEYNNMEYIAGKATSNIINTTDKVIII